MTLFTDLFRAFGQLDDRRFLGAVIWSLLLTLVGLVVIFWLVMVLLGAALPETVNLPFIGTVSFVDNLASWAAAGLMLVLSVVLMVPTAAAVVGFFLDSVVEAVEARHYPHLPEANPASTGSQIIDSIRFFGLLIMVNLVALVIYLLVAPLAPFIFWIVNGLLLGREYFTLVALRRLSPADAAKLRRNNRMMIWVAGTLMAVPLSVPVLNLIVPVLGVAVFTHQFHRMAGSGFRA
ncbi:EI24 domain-containing protein [Amaricoccus tamworthensis]|uniref:EI24 domain-containing protein n=1 Tax=Amaricoccus tamworthensis TaxID=57002 RepID=UPI003C7A6DEB